jgi:hypothetical protein
LSEMAVSLHMTEQAAGLRPHAFDAENSDMP